MLKDSGLLDDLERNAFSPVTGEAMCIYGDPAYPLQLHLQQPFREAPLTTPMEQFNKGFLATLWLHLNSLISRKILKLG